MKTIAINDYTLGYETRFETIYEDVSYQGVLNVAFKIKSIENHEGNKIDVVIMVSNKRPMEAFVARKLQIKLEGGNKIELDASTHDVKQLVKEMTSNICYFRLTPEQFKDLMSHKLESLTISDKRTNQSLEVLPYNGIIKEQAICLNQEFVLPYAYTK